MGRKRIAVIAIAALLCWDANRIVVDGCSCLALCNAKPKFEPSGMVPDIL